MDINLNTRLLAHQQNILTKLALGSSLNEILETICLSIEELFNDKTVKCSILTLEDNKLYTIASPSLPIEYANIMHGIKIGEAVGSCGTAAYTKSPVFVEDISKSELWSGFKHITEQFSLESCWSTPILSITSDIIGTFAIYHESPKIASKENIELINHFAHLSSIAFDKNTANQKLNTLIKDLESTNKKLNALTTVTPDPIIITDKDGTYIDVYGSAEHLLSSPKNDLIGQNLNNVLSPKDAQLVMENIDKTLKTNCVQVFEYGLKIGMDDKIFEGRTTPITYSNDSGEKKHILWIIRDITERKLSEEKIKNLAYYDHLTNLPNRRLLVKNLDLSVKRINNTNSIGALLYLDLDNFKRINDSLGHKAGDLLLIELANRLNLIVKKPDTLARIGGDEFILLIDNLGNNHELAKQKIKDIAQKIQNVFINKFTIEDLSFQITGSIGICFIERTVSSTEKILQFADTAMYKVKAKGGNNFSFHDAKLQTLVEKQIELETSIVQAIDNNEFCAYFQPQVDLQGEVISAEALIRWIHPIKGVVSPDQFISVAEQFGLIQKLQNIVLENICELINKLAAQKILSKKFSVSINMCQNQFNSPSLKRELLNIINKFGITPKRVKLEITESMLSHDLHYTVEQMKSLVKEGFSFSIDDFGTGYSCLSTLQVYPVKELKIDKSFIDKIIDDKTGLPIVETIINLANNLNMSVIAEGVENKKQHQILKDKKIDAIQGYFIAKPMPVNEYLDWHANNIK